MRKEIQDMVERQRTDDDGRREKKNPRTATVKFVDCLGLQNRDHLTFPVQIKQLTYFEHITTEIQQFGSAKESKNKEDTRSP